MKKSIAIAMDFLEAPPGFEPGDKGFADPCLTTWLWRRIQNMDIIAELFPFVKGVFQFILLSAKKRKTKKFEKIKKRA